MTQRVLAESRGYRGPIDWAGAAFFTVCAATLTFALIHGGNNGWDSPATLGAFAIAAVALTGFIAAMLGTCPLGAKGRPRLSVTLTG
jgi:hypothetical protein